MLLERFGEGAGQGEEGRDEARVCWVYDQPWVPAWVLYTERMHTIKERGEEEGGGVEVRTWENFRVWQLMW